ncbi:transposase [Patescibacteria group bacterium]|nr:transposase [Patescibacteria group bacterium]
MPSRKLELVSEQFYHVYNRGINKESIFLQGKDYERFLFKTEEYKKKYNIRIFAWSLLPNHFHMLIKAAGDQVRTSLNAVSSFLLKLQQSHALYFKYKYDKIGPVFQGRFNAKPVYDDEYLIQLLHYIHRQPSHHNISSDTTWPYTSLGSYLYASPDSDLITVDNYYDSFKSFEGLLESGLEPW